MQEGGSEEGREKVRKTERVVDEIEKTVARTWWRRSRPSTQPISFDELINW